MIGGRGSVKVTVNQMQYPSKSGENIQHLVIEMKLSSIMNLSQKERNHYYQLPKEKDMVTILSNENVNIHNQMAIIICNQVGWTIAFDTYHTDTMCRLTVPLKDESEVQTVPYHGSSDNDQFLEEEKSEAMYNNHHFRQIPHRDNSSRLRPIQSAPQQNKMLQKGGLVRVQEALGEEDD